MNDIGNRADDGIAIVGMAGRFPGAPSVEALWDVLREGRETVRELTDSELEAEEYDYDAVKDDPGYVKARGTLDDVDMFDAPFFSMNPREAALLDPQQRLWLECAWEALERAGHAPESFDGTIGVFGGSYINTYLLNNLCVDREYVDRLVRMRAPDAFQTFISNDKDYLPTRTAYKFDLRGPAVTVQTACSTSLVAIVQACQSLAGHETDLCLAGGVCISFPQAKGYLYQEGGMVSPDGHCRAFDAGAQGTVFSNGLGVVALKRLEDATRDGDHIHAVIRGWALNNDGAAKLSYPAPSVDGQAEVIALAQALGEIDPETITYVEAHGTGTPLGDPIEVAGLTKAFRRSTGKKQFCGIGSIKSNLGHLDSAAGVAGLIKAALALENELIPPTLHFERPNPEIDFAESPFYVVAEPTPWPRGPEPRRAGVSSFGVGGTNAHVVLEEAPARATSAPSRSRELLVLSAKTETALDAASQELGGFLREREDLALGDVSFTLATGRTHFPYRRMVVARDPLHAADLLQGKSRRPVATGHADGTERSVVFMFPGQGAQHVNMGRALYDEEPVFRTHVDAGAEALRSILNLDIRDLLYPSPSEEEAAAERLKQTEITQPVLFVIQYALARLWEKWGVRPDAMVGHSVGEYVAACLAEVLSFSDALTVLAERARLMQAQPRGGMLAVRLPGEALTDRIEEPLALAALNSPNLSVVSGPHAELASFQEALEAEGVRTTPLHTSHAYHSSMMDAALAPFEEALSGIEFHAPRIPWVSTLTGTWITDEEATSPEYWAQQLRRTVRFSPAVEELQTVSGRIFLEVGPGNTLSTFVLQHPEGEARRTVISSLGHPQDEASALELMLSAAGTLWTAGGRLDWEGMRGGEARSRVILPTYPFERKRHWIDAPRSQPSARSPQPPSALPSGPAVPEQATPHERQPTMDRQSVILSRVSSVFGELSGMDLADEDPGRTFMEMGFDSLFLTQASSELEREFGVKVKFRQLLEELPTLEALTEYLDSELPPDALAEEEPVAPSQAPAAPVPSGAGSPAPSLAQATGGSTSALEQLIQGQLGIMQQQLAALRGEATQPAPASEGGAGDGMPTVSGVNDPFVQARVDPSGQTREGSGRFGPYKPIERARDGGLTDRQQEHLRDLIERFNRSTAGSKAFHEENHSGVADPRAVAGFRQIWKEAVYQIVSDRSRGSRIWDVDGNEYIDFTMCFGANLLGHAPPLVVEAVQEQLQRGFEIGPQSSLTGEVAALVRKMTGMERVSFCNTGSEAVMATMRMARTVTGRDRIAYFSGSYHGTIDEVLGRSHARNGELFTLPAAPGVPQGALNNAMVLEYGSPESLEVIESCADQLAAVIVEPVQSRHPELRPVEFVRKLRDLADHHGFALVFDEVITGFRVHPKGAAAFYGVEPDIASYGKVVAGGLPIGIVAGRSRFMDALDGGAWQFGDDSVPEADITFFAGTFVRHPLALAASRAVLSHLMEEGPALQEGLARKVSAFAEELNAFFEARGVPVRIRHFSSWFRFDFPSDLTNFNLLLYHLLARGIYIREAGQNCFISTAHTDADLRAGIEAIKESVIELQDAGFFPRPAADESDGESSGPEVLPHRYPLTEAQREVWLASQLGDDASCAYNTGFTATLRGDPPIDVMVRAIRDVIRRHEGLHVRFSPDGEYQEAIDPDSFEVSIIDLTDLSDAERDRRCQELLALETGTAFDLTEGPLLRIKIVRRTPAEVLLVFTAHHLVCDGWSAAVLIEEMSQAYSSMVQGDMWVLEPAYPYRHYVALERTEEARTATARALEFWKERFRHLPEPLELPTDRPRPPSKSYQGATLKWSFTPEAHEAITRVAREEGATLFVTLLTTFHLLLHRLSGQEDLVVAVPAAGQLRVGQNALVGHCVNLLPIRNELDSQWSFRELLKQTKRELLDAYDHQEVSFGQIVREVEPDRNPARLPLVEVMFNLDRDSGVLGFHGLESEVRETPKQAVNFELFFNINEADGRLTMDLDYSAALFDEETMRRWAVHLDTLMQAVAEAPGQPVGTLPLVRPEDLPEAGDGVGGEESDLLDETVVGLVQRQVIADPDRMAVEAGQQRMTYGELSRFADQLAARLAEAGVSAGSRVGVILPRTLELPGALLGVMKAGAAYVPLDPDFPSERLQFIVDDASVDALVVPGAGDELPISFQGKVIALDQVSEADHGGVESLDGAVTPTDTAYVIYTSGSTGRPKGVVVTHRNVANLLQSMAREPGLSEQDRLLAVTTLSFDISVLELFLPLTVGACVIVADAETVRDGFALASTLADSRTTVMQATPSLWQVLLDTGWEGDPDLVALCGGEALPPDLGKRLAKATKAVWNMYGPTETTIWSTCHQVRGDEDPVPIGRPVANTSTYVLDPNGQLLPPGVVGELYIGGLGVTEGYWNRPELTEEAFLPDPFGGGERRMYRTGDLARLRPDGVLECLGRTDSQVKVRGYRVELGEVEAALSSLEAVSQAAATVWTPRSGDTRLIAYVVPSGNQVSTDDLREALRQRLPEYMVPQHLETLEALPLTANGKVDRRRLPTPDLQPGDPVETGDQEPATEVEVSVAEVWKAVIGTERVGRGSNFFDLGGHSVLAAHAVARLRQVFDVPVSLRHLFEAPTVDGLAKQIEALRHVASSVKDSRESNGGPRDESHEEVVF